MYSSKRKRHEDVQERTKTYLRGRAQVDEPVLPVQLRQRVLGWQRRRGGARQDLVDVCWQRRRGPRRRRRRRRSGIHCSAGGLSLSYLFFSLPRLRREVISQRRTRGVEV